MNDLEIKSIASDLLHENFSDVAIIDTDEVYVSKTKEKTIVGGASIPQKMRALSLLTLNKDRDTCEIRQKPRFNQLGAMLDVSRGSVMRVEKVKEYISKLALFGANELMLYTEDIYTLEDYPYFGYQRGAYSDDELRDIDNYAYSLGIEVTPCIQTLGHMERYLTWSEARPIRDTLSVLLCDEEATMKFIEAEIAKMRLVFRSNKIHIGMDEAHDVGCGTYLHKHGFVDRFDLLKRHVDKVADICRRYDFEPMMWSDMFFRIGSPTNDYYDPDGIFPVKVTENIPEVAMVYWDYYHQTCEFYDKMIARHRELNRPIIFAGTIYTTRGFLPDYGLTYACTEPGLESCIKNGIDHVFVAIWGDDGSETDYFRAMYGFAIYSEYCYDSADVKRETIERMGELISGVSTEQVRILCDNKYYYLKKPLIWSDIFLNTITEDFTNRPEILKSFNDSADALISADDEFAYLVMKISAEKAHIHTELQRRYKSGQDLIDFVENCIPELITDYKRMAEIHQEIWLSVNKPFGLEVIQARYAAAVCRLEYAQKIIGRYIAREINNIEELEYQPLHTSRRYPIYNYLAFNGTLTIF